MKATYYYRFEDGYECWTQGKMSASDKAWTIREHGKMITMKQV